MEEDRSARRYPIYLLIQDRHRESVECLYVLYIFKTSNALAPSVPAFV